MSWLFFAVSTYALYSITNFIEKFLIDKKIKHFSNVIILGGVFDLIIGFVIFTIKGFHILPMEDTLLLSLSGILLTLYLLPYYSALSLDDASRVVPLFQFFPVFVLIISYLFLHETLTVHQLFGFFFITIGGLILGMKKFNLKIFQLRKSFWYMMLSSFLYGLTGIIFRYIHIKDYWVSVSYQTMAIGITSILFLLYTPYRTYFSKEIPKFKFGIYRVLMTNSAIALLAEFANFYAITLAPVALVSVIQGVQPLFLITYGYILTLFFPHIIKEDIRKETIGIKIISIILLFLGIYFIYL